MSKGFIGISPDQDVTLPRGAWKPFECCSRRNNNCLLSLCPAYSNPELVSWEQLEIVHTSEYLQKIRTSRKALYTIFEIQEDDMDDRITSDDEHYILDPIRRHIGGLIMGAREAFTNKSIVIVPDSGYHHASRNNGDGACVFADVPLAWNLIRTPNSRALYIDVDVHHANGFADYCSDNFYMLDMYNDDIWPDDKHSVQIPSPYHCGIGNKAFLTLLNAALKQAENVHFDMIFYMCSNDALQGDPLGHVNVTERCIYQRDATVVKWARDRGLPIVIMPSRGYGASSCRVARESMLRLNDEYNIW